MAASWRIVADGASSFAPVQAKAADARIGGVTFAGISGGQKRRLSVAIELLTLPSIVILDEPTSGLDASTSLELCTDLSA